MRWEPSWPLGSTSNIPFDSLVVSKPARPAVWPSPGPGICILGVTRDMSRPDSEASAKSTHSSGSCKDRTVHPASRTTQEEGGGPRSPRQVPGGGFESSADSCMTLARRRSLFLRHRPEPPPSLPRRTPDSRQSSFLRGPRARELDPCSGSNRHRPLHLPRCGLS